MEDEKLQRLKDCINEEGFRLDILTDAEGKNIMADILARDHRIRLGNKAFREGLAS